MIAAWRFVLYSLCLWNPAVFAQSSAPALAADFQTMLDAPLSPISRANPEGTQLLFLERSATLPSAYLAAPWIGLAGAEIATDLGASKRRRYLHSPYLVDIASKTRTAIDVPNDRNINAFEFSPNGRQLALLIDASMGVELWLVDTASGAGRRVRNLLVNDIYTSPMSWSPDSLKIYVAARVGDELPRGPKAESATIEEAGGTKVPSRTYAHLLRSPGDVELFKAYARVQWKEVQVSDLRQRVIGSPGLYSSLDPAPGTSELLVRRIVPPFSYAVPAALFGRHVEVWQGDNVQRVLTTPLAEDVPPEGERRGPREVRWQADYPARLLWLEALDEGDPRKKVEHRDRLLSLAAPYRAEPIELTRVVDRVASVQFLPEKDRFLVRSFNPDTNVSTLSYYQGRPTGLPTLLSYDIKDDYNNPGRLVTITDAKGITRVVKEGAFIFLAGDGKNKDGEQPFLDRLNLETLAKERLFSSEAKADFLEEFVFFYRNKSEQIVLSHESQTSPPNLWLWQRGTQKKTAITQFKDNVPAMTQAEKRPLVFQRKDGLTMSGTLYVPRAIKPAEKLPAIVWAYPEEYRSAAVAGQVRVSTQRYSRPSPTGIEWLVTQGYAVLDNASMPLIGEKESVNNTLVTQLVANAQAVIDALDGTGQVDRKRIAVGGHSYGAFMTANLLAHSQLFCAGLARSGAYNRSLTPFGFQSERRTFWEAKDFYMNASPFYHADSIKTPLLLVHGKDDNNPGTTPMQTERMFHALRGVGAKARMVLLPHESHGYRGRDNVSLVQAETLGWLQRWCS